MSTNPSQKAGTDCPRSAKLRPRLSKTVALFTADNTPRGMPSTTDTTMATPESWSVAGSFSKMSSSEFRLVTNDSPKSPLTALPSHSPYWTTSGLLIPSASPCASHSSTVYFL